MRIQAKESSKSQTKSNEKNKKRKNKKKNVDDEMDFLNNLQGTVEIEKQEQLKKF